MTHKCLNWLDNYNNALPVMVFDLEKLKKNYFLFKKKFLGIKPYYAVKANPNHKIINSLNCLGSYFDCASINEIKLCIRNNVNPRKISFGNTIKKEKDIREAYKLGIKIFAYDAKQELEKIAKHAPGAKVFCRIQVPNGGSQWPLSNKFGCNPESVENFIILSKKLKLDPAGISFHVGSQQKSKETWDKAIKLSSRIYKEMEKKGIILNLLNIGGGIPSKYNDGACDLSIYSEYIKNSILKHYGNKKPSNIICEPGRFLVADAAIIETEVILISVHSTEDKKKWVYIDVGRYNGLAETEGEAIHYKITAKGYEKCKKSNYILAGPSCDSHDIIYKKKPCYLPRLLKIGDKLRIHSTGAYTTTYSSNFNGIKKIREYYLD